MSFVFRSSFESRFIGEERNVYSRAYLTQIKAPIVGGISKSRPPTQIFIGPVGAVSNRTGADSTCPDAIGEPPR